MRTTITLEPDVEALVKKRMRERGISFKQAMKDGIRKGIAPSPRVPVTFPTYKMGKPRIDITKSLQIAGQLEDEEILRRMGLDPPTGERQASR